MPDALHVLQNLGQGRLLDELVAALEHVAAEVSETGKPGTVTLNLKVSTRAAGDAFVMIEESVTRKPPTKAARGSYFYAVDGALYRDDPRQMRLELREVDRSTGEIREHAEQAPVVREVSQ